MSTYTKIQRFHNIKSWPDKLED